MIKVGDIFYNKNEEIKNFLQVVSVDKNYVTLRGIKHKLQDKVANESSLYYVKYFKNQFMEKYEMNFLIPDNDLGITKKMIIKIL